MGVWGTGSEEYAGYDYVQSGQPKNPTEGETWYDVDGDAAFVYDGAAWVEMTVTDHGQLANVNPSQHHSRPTSTQSASDTPTLVSVVSGSLGDSVSVGEFSGGTRVTAKNTNSTYDRDMTVTVHFDPWGNTSQTKTTVPAGESRTFTFGHRFTRVSSVSISYDRSGPALREVECAQGYTESHAHGI